MLRKSISQPSFIGFFSSPSPFQPHTPLSYLSAFSAPSANELSLNDNSRSASPVPLASAPISPSPSCTTAQTFILEAQEIITRFSQSERAIMRRELITCANRFIQWDVEQVKKVVNDGAVCDQHPLFVAVVLEQLAQSDQVDLSFKARLLDRAICDYLFSNDLDGARGCIAQLVETNEYHFICSRAEASVKPPCSHPNYSAVLYEALALMLLNHPGHEPHLDEAGRQDLIDRYHVYTVYLAASGGLLAYAKQITLSKLESMTIPRLLLSAKDMQNNIRNPLYCAIIYDVIINIMLSNRPSNEDRGAMKRHDDKLILYFKSAIRLYAMTNHTEQLIITLSAYRSFDQSGRLIAILQKDEAKGVEMTRIAKALEVVVNTEHTEDTPTMRR